MQLGPPEGRREAQRLAPLTGRKHWRARNVLNVVLAHSTRGTGQSHAASTAQPPAKAASRPGAQFFHLASPLKYLAPPLHDRGKQKISRQSARLGWSTKSQPPRPGRRAKKSSRPLLRAGCVRGEPQLLPMTAQLRLFSSAHSLTGVLSVEVLSAVSPPP